MLIHTISSGCLRLILSGTLLSLMACSAAPERAPASMPDEDIASATAVSIESTEPAQHDTQIQDQELSNALATLKDGDLKKAEKLLLALSQRRSGEAVIYDNLGIVYFRNGRLDESEQAFRKATTLNARDYVAYDYLGIVYRNMGRFKEAQVSYVRSLEIKPDYPLAHYNLAMLYDIYLGKPALAIYHYSKYLELTGSDDKKVKGWLADLRQREQITSSVKDRDNP